VARAAAAAGSRLRRTTASEFRGSVASVTIAPAGSVTASWSASACGQSGRYSGIHNSTSTAPSGRRTVSSSDPNAPAADGTMAHAVVGVVNRSGDEMVTIDSETAAAGGVCLTSSLAKYRSRLGASSTSSRPPR